jgi:hypothetical protein
VPGAIAEQQLQRVRELVIAIDDLKLTVQLAKDVARSQASMNSRRSRASSMMCGRQSGGWLKRLHSHEPECSADLPLEQRAQILSSRAASPSGATP